LGLFTNASWAQASFGDFTPARGILLSILIAILIASADLLLDRDSKLVSVVFLMQVVDKLTTPLTVGTVQNPVVVSNLGIAAKLA